MGEVIQYKFLHHVIQPCCPTDDTLITIETNKEPKHKTTSVDAGETCNLAIDTVNRVNSLILRLS